MEQRNFIDSWLLPCSLRSHRTANPTPKNGLRHFSALPTHHPTSEQDNEMLDKKSRILVNLFQYKIDSVVQNYFEAEKSEKNCNFAF